MALYILIVLICRYESTHLLSFPPLSVNKCVVFLTHPVHCIVQVMVNVQMLAELEEVIQFKLVPERREVIYEMWWNRLRVCHHHNYHC